jgi:hypothetical protein
MKVKTAFIIFGSCFILGIIFFVVGGQGWIVGQASSLVTGTPTTTPVMFMLSNILMPIGFLGLAGTLTYWQFFGRKKRES